MPDLLLSALGPACAVEVPAGSAKGHFAPGGSRPGRLFGAPPGWRPRQRPTGTARKPVDEGHTKTLPMTRPTVPGRVEGSAPTGAPVALHPWNTGSAARCPLAEAPLAVWTL